MRFYKSLQNLTKAMIFHDIFLVQSLTFIPFCSFAMYYWHFIISYRNEQSFSVCYLSVSPLGNTGKNFAINKRKVIFPISQILNKLAKKVQLFVHGKPFRPSVKLIGPIHKLRRKRRVVNTVLAGFTINILRS